MTISNTKAKSVYETNGERREWEIGFDFDSNVSKLNIILEDREGYQTVVEDNYLIEDGVVIYPSLESELDPIAEGYKIILFRSTPNTQEIDLRDNVTEKGLDKLTLQVQELSEQVERAVKVPLVEEGVKEYQDLVLKVREERDTALEQIKEATSVVSDYTQASALNAVTSKEEADRAVEASNTSVMASADAEASAIEAANLANEAKDAVSAYVNGLGAMRNAVLDLGVFEDNQRRASSSIIDFDYEPLDVFVRFSDSEKKMWINGSHSFAGIEKVEDRKYKIFYSVFPEDFASQSAIKGPFNVQYVIKYSVFSGKPVMYRGRVDTVDQLPETAEDGDLWYVGPVEQSNKEEYIWQNGKWELLGSTDFTNIYTKEEIDNKVKVIEADIDANADAIQKTRSDFMESDSELQQQINAHATEITTLKNDTDELGDQVAGIESKIPEGTSDTNPLVNKQQLSDAIQGGGSVPDNVYTEDNLIGGKDIEIIKKSGGIDENTIACWHFDTSANDEVNGLPAGPFAGENNLLSDYVKFGEKSFNGGFTNTSLSFNSNESFSFDFWAHLGIPGSSSYVDTGYCGLAGNTNIFYVYGVAGSKMNVFLHGTTTTTDFVTPRSNWFHVYGGYDHETKTYSVFANGKRIFSQVNDKSFNTSFFSISYQGSGVRRYDEVRVSKCVRWTEDFTPPEVPYEAGSAGSVINFTGQSGKNIGEVYYSQSSLASDNAGALPLFTGETIASADTIYPDFYAWVNSHTELQTTAEEYETALTTYGECAKYVVSDGSLRLPKLTNYIKMANAAEGITQSEAGLPNIEGGFIIRGGYVSYARGAIKQSSNANSQDNTGNGNVGNDGEIDASLSSEVYGKSDTVTPAHTTLYPWVFAYNATVPASTAQAAEFQEGLSGKADTNLSNIPTNYDYVVDSYSDEEGNWYRVYKSGWIEQGGNKYVGNWTTITLLKPMATDRYTITTASQISITENPGTKVSAPTTTSFQIAMKWDASQYKQYIAHWIVEGQGA